MRRTDLLITQCRLSTENNEYTDTAGIQDNEIIQYINDGQDELYGIMINLFPDKFQSEKVYDVTSGQEVYAIPEDCYIGERVELVEYSRSGLDSDYYLLQKGDKRERLNSLSGYPSFYIRRSGNLYLQPKPQGGGKLRVLYQQALRSLDIRRGKVLSATFSGNTITSLFLDPSEYVDSNGLVDNEYITIVDSHGAAKMSRIPITAINTTTGQITIEAGFTFETGETISAGNYALRGGYSTTHSGLPDPFENYILEYTNARILMRDSSADSAEITNLVNTFQSDIARTMAEPDGDVIRPAIIDSQYLSFGDEW